MTSAPEAPSCGADHRGCVGFARASAWLEPDASRQLLFDQLTDDRAVRSAADLRHDVGHHAAEVAHRGGAVLGDRVVDDLLELVFGQRLRHELLEHRELALLRSRLLVAAAATESLGRLDAALPLALQHLQLLLVGERTLKLFLRRAQARQDQAQRVAAVGVARQRGLLEVVLHPRDQAHPGIPCSRPPSTCQCRWKTVWPPPPPTFTTTR